MFPTISVRSLHLEYQLWVRELVFYKEEIKIFEHHLEILVQRNNKSAVMAQVEHFQNQFIRQKEVIDIIVHHLNTSEKQLASFVYGMSGSGMDSIRMDNHPKLREDVITFRKIYKELKEEFRRFEAEWM
jgi:hypothetical protein